MPPRKSHPTLLTAAAAAALVVGGVGYAPTRASAAADPDRGGGRRPPTGFDTAAALDFYSAESASLLKRSMLAGGFSIHEASEDHEAYVDFASRALSAERRRIRAALLRLIGGGEFEAALLERSDGAAAGMCSAGDGDCGADDRGASARPAKKYGSASQKEKDDAASRKEKDDVTIRKEKDDVTSRKEKDDAASRKEKDDAASQKEKDDRLSPEFGHFLTPDLKPGQVETLRWDDDGTVVQEYAARVGLPPAFVPTLKEYAEGMGLLDIMTNMLYDDPLPPDGVRWFSFQSPYQREAGARPDEMRNFTWNVERPSKNWRSDMHWFNTADELSHEDALRALARGGFDEVLRGIGERFGLDELHVDSVGFVAVTECERGFVHTDMEDTDGRAFNFLVGVASPDGAGPELVVEGDRMKGETYYRADAGILVGDETRHGTRECDHRAERGVRITASIYLADVIEDNLDIMAGDTTSIFPPTGELGMEWIWTQRGRHWRREGGGEGLAGDKGRAAFEVRDEEGCSEEDCTDDTELGRNGCLRTCRVFMDDAVYQPGKERREVLGY